KSVDGARMAEVELHPCGWFDGAHGVGADSARRSLGLQFIGEDIVVTLLPVVQEAAGGSEKVECLRNLLTLSGGPQPVGFGGSGRRFLYEPGHPVSDMVVAQTAGGIFDIRLEMKDRVAFLFVALAIEVGEVIEQRNAFARDQPRDDFVVQAGK